MHSEADDDDGLVSNAPQQCARLSNSEMLKNLTSHLMYLSGLQKQDIINLIQNLPNLFSDTPTQASVIKHDITVENSSPNKVTSLPC